MNEDLESEINIMKRKGMIKNTDALGCQTSFMLYWLFPQLKPMCLTDQHAASAGLLDAVLARNSLEVDIWISDLEDNLTSLHRDW